MNRYLAPCILPYSALCPYKRSSTPRRPTAFCDDITTGPGNSDAACFKVTWKKQMIENSLDSGVALVVMEDEKTPQQAAQNLVDWYGKGGIDISALVDKEEEE